MPKSTNPQIAIFRTICEIPKSKWNLSAFVKIVRDQIGKLKTLEGDSEANIGLKWKVGGVLESAEQGESDYHHPRIWT